MIRFRGRHYNRPPERGVILRSDFMNSTRYLLSRPAVHLAVCVALAGSVACGKAIPVQELSEARIQLDAAEQDGAPEYSAESYNQAREALLAAHKQLGDEKYDLARASAVQATGLALDAREKAAPQAVAAKQSEAQAAIAAADEAYAEVLAAQDFAAAQNLYSEGEAAHADAGQKQSQSGAADLSSRLAALNSLSTARRKFTDSSEAALRAKNIALAQKGDMLDSLDGVRSNLQKAEAWGAGDEDVDEIASVRATLSRAEDEINDGKLKAASASMQEAEGASKALLAKVAAAHAKKKLEEARVAVDRADGNFNAVNTDANRKDEETGDILDTLSAQLDAAKEARASAATHLEQSNFEHSISESEDAIRLSQIIFEQYNLLAGATTRDSSEIGEGSGDADTDTAVVSEPGETPEGWREYTVQRRVPADCLWCIAQRGDVYGNGRFWKRIYEANKATIKNPNLIFPGQRLVIPPKGGDLKRPDPAIKEEEEVQVESDDSEEESTIIEQAEEQIESATEDATMDSDDEAADDDDSMMMEHDASEDMMDSDEEQPAETVE
jgi:nucleoid-associated protein YgaU